MSQRNSPEAKRARRARRTLRKGVLPAYIDLIDWVKIRSNLSTRRAVGVILAGSLKVDSHIIGVKEIGPAKMKVLDRYVPADLRGRIEVVIPEVLRDG